MFLKKLSLREHSFIIGISLGMNSSCVVINSSGEIICGYEEERFTKNKRESSFPINSLNQCLLFIPKNSFLHIGISHWFDNFDNNDSGRYKIDIVDYLKKLDYNIVTFENKIDHHYLHHISAIPFISNISLDSPLNFLIIDGFGNNQSTITILKYNKAEKYFDSYNDSADQVIVHRDLYSSLGIYFEELTRACGLKPKGDEYKILGYESKISSFISSPEILSKFIKRVVRILETSIYESQEFSFHTQEDLINFNKLEEVSFFWKSLWNSIYSELNISDSERPYILGYIGQSALEVVILNILKSYNLTDENLILSGGVFYNVKLNNEILNLCNKRVEFVPVCGDQGGSIGVATHLFRRIFRDNPVNSDLLVGKRNYREIKEKDIDNIVNDIVDNKIVNFCYGDMEFGPRSLCNTSTLCLPTSENVKYINKINVRDEAMPMAPVMLKSNSNFFFNEKESSKCIDSKKYMITTFLYREEIDLEKYSGVMHNKPFFNNIFSGRPQCVEENTIIGKILKKVEQISNTKCLINTSFNVHGHPICYSKRDVEDNYNFQKKLDIENRVVLHSFIVD